jgi:RNA polymerase sigma-70 factor (ECF subfamily)
LKLAKEREGLEGSTYAPELQDFPAFYRAFERRIRGTIFQMGAQGELDDLAQQVLIQCWESRSQFQGRSKLSTWVIQITMNLVRDYFKSSYTKNNYVDLESVSDLESRTPSSLEMELDYHQWVEKGLSTLDWEYRTVITLRYFQDLSLDEIAEVTGEKEGTVKSRLHYAKAKLREFFERKGISL